MSLLLSEHDMASYFLLFKVWMFDNSALFEGKRQVFGTIHRSSFSYSI
jgi:hypothetical protein